jgi:DNA-binding MarR family transcriptional regulator
MDRTTLGRNVQPLARDGLIVIEPDTSDGRSRILRLTGMGERRFERAQKGWAEAQKCFEDAYGRKTGLSTASKSARRDRERTGPDRLRRFARDEPSRWRAITPKGTGEKDRVIKRKECDNDDFGRV